MNENVPTWLPRVLGVLAGWGASKLTESTGVTVDPSALTAIGLGAYAIVHRYASSKINPADAAKRELVAPGKTNVEAIKSTGGTST